MLLRMLSKLDEQKGERIGGLRQTNRAFAVILGLGGGAVWNAVVNCNLEQRRRDTYFQPPGCYLTQSNYVNTVHGIRSVDPKLLEMASVYGFKWTTVLGHVVLPGALPSILVGLRQSLGIAWIALVVSESIAARSGIGYLAMDAREFMQTDVVVLVIFIYAAMGQLSDSLVQVLERRLIPWRSSRSLA